MLRREKERDIPELLWKVISRLCENKLILFSRLTASMAPKSPPLQVFRPIPTGLLAHPLPAPIKPLHSFVRENISACVTIYIYTHIHIDEVTALHGYATRGQSRNYSVYFLLRKNVLFWGEYYRFIVEEGRDCDSEEKGKKKRVRTKRRCLIIIRGTSRRWIRIDNSKRVITCPIQNRCQREKCGWDTGVDVIENKRGWSKSRWRGNGYADSTTEYRRAFTASRKIFRAGLSEHFLAEACAGVARSIDRGYVLLQTGTRVLERKLMRENLN